MNLIIGDNQLRNAQHDADVFSCVFGDGAYILPYGEQLAVTVINNNTVRVGSGIMIIEGKPVQIAIGEYEDFTIPTGSQGVNVTYYIGFRIYRDSAGEHVEKYIGVADKDQGSIRNGDAEMYGIIAKVPLNGINLDGPVMVAETVAAINGVKTGARCAYKSVVINLKTATSSFRILTFDDIREMLNDPDLTAQEISSYCSINVSNGHWEANHGLPICTTTRQNTQDVYVHLVSNTSGAIRINIVVTYKGGNK